MNKTIKEIFEFGIKEIQMELILEKGTYILHLEDFIEGGCLKDFYEHNVEMFKWEFGCTLSFR